MYYGYSADDANYVGKHRTFGNRMSFSESKSFSGKLIGSMELAFTVIETFSNG